MTRPIDVPRPPAPTPAEPFPAPWPGGPCIDAWTVVGSCEGDGDEPCDCLPCRTFAASAAYAPMLRWGWQR